VQSKIKKNLFDQIQMLTNSNLYKFRQLLFYSL